MTEHISLPTPEDQPTLPEIFMDTSVGKNLEIGESVEVDEDNLRHILEQLPLVDPAKLRIRIVGFYDNQYALSGPDENGVVTITLSAKGGEKQLSLALGAYADLIEQRPAHSAVAQEAAAVGEVASDILNRRGQSMGMAAMGAFPGLIAVSLLENLDQRPSRRTRKFAKRVKKTPVISIDKREE